MNALLQMIIDAITALLRRATVTVTHATSTPWASATFTGARHDIDLIVKGADAVAAARQFVATAAEVDFAIDGQIVADVAITGYSVMGEDVRLTIEVLRVDAL